MSAPHARPCPPIRPRTNVARVITMDRSVYGRASPAVTVTVLDEIDASREDLLGALTHRPRLPIGSVPSSPRPTPRRW